MKQLAIAVEHKVHVCPLTKYPVKHVSHKIDVVPVCTEHVKQLVIEVEQDWQFTVPVPVST